MFSQIKDRKHIEQNFHSVAGTMRQGWDLGVPGGGGGGSKTLVWGFAMAPHRLRILVLFYFPFKNQRKVLKTLEIMFIGKEM